MKNKNYPMVTIIIPAYNSEKTIEKCVNSALAQTYKNLEIIIINDGSTDETLNICRKIANKNKNIIIINKDNEGVSKARNDAIKISSGDYLAFFDADDYAEKDMIKKMLNRMINDGTDISICEYNIITKGISKRKILREYSDRDFRSVISDETTEYGGFIWNKIVKKKCITYLYDEKIAYYENLVFLLKNSCNIKSYSLIQEPLYNYVINDNSATHTKVFNCKKKMTTLDALQIAMKESSDKYKDIYKYHIYSKSRELYYASGNPKAKKQIEISASYYKTLRKSQILSANNKAKLMIMRFAPHIHKLVINKRYIKQ